MSVEPTPDRKEHPKSMDHSKYIGMDVHKETISIAVMDSAGKLVMESIIETKAATILQFMQGLRGSLYVTFEEGTWAAWLYDLLKPHVTKVVACNPRRNAGHHFRDMGLEQVVQPSRPGPFFEGHIQASAQPLHKLKNCCRFRFDNGLHYQLAGGIHHGDRDRFLVNIHADILAVIH